MSTRELRALLRSPAEKTGLPVAVEQLYTLEMLVLIPLRARLSRRESLRATLTVVLRLGVCDNGVLMELLRECGLPPKSKNSPHSRGHPEQKGQNSHRISQPSRTILPGHELRLPPGMHGRSIWYHRCWHSFMETLSSAIHMVLFSCGDSELMTVVTVMTCLVKRCQ